MDKQGTQRLWAPWQQVVNPSRRALHRDGMCGHGLTRLTNTRQFSHLNYHFDLGEKYVENNDYVVVHLVDFLTPKWPYNLLSKLGPSESKTEDGHVISNNPVTTQIWRGNILQENREIQLPYFDPKQWSQ